MGCLIVLGVTASSTHVKISQGQQVWNKLSTSLYSGVASFVSEEGIFIYSCSAQLISFSVQKTNLWICPPDLSSWQRHWVWNKLLTTCNNLVDIIRLVTRLFQQGCYNHDITILLQPCVVNLVTFLLYHDCIWHVRTTL